MTSPFAGFTVGNCRFDGQGVELPTIPPANVNADSMFLQALDLAGRAEGEPNDRFAERGRRAAVGHDLPARPTPADSAEGGHARMRSRVQVPTGSGLQHPGAVGSASDVSARLPESLRTLPPDIATLFGLANDSFPLFELPLPFGAMAEAHGLPNLQFPCQVAASLLTKSVTERELAGRLRAAENMHASFKGSFPDCVMTTYRCMMVGFLALNVVSAVQLLSSNHQNPQSSSAIRFAGEVVPAMVHGMIFKNMSEVQRKLRSLGWTDLSEHGALEAGNQDVAQLVRRKVQQLRASGPSDKVRMLLAMLTLMAANFVISKAGG